VLHSEGRFSGSGGVELYAQQWLPDGEPNAVVALVHGVGEHCGRYPHVVGPLVEAGYAVYSYDHRGHGRSDGPRVHVDRWAEYRSDLAAHLERIAAEHPGRPVVLYGHSMGSLVALDYLVRGADAVAAAVISGTALHPVGVGSPVQIAMARLLTHVTPRVRVSLGIKPSDLTRDPVEADIHRADPMLTDRATVRWGTESLDTVAAVKPRLSAIEVPLLIVHGEADPLNSVEGARALYEAASSADKTLRVYAGAKHELHNDLCHEQVARDVVEWLDRVVGARPTVAGRPASATEERA
jgi:alpha-beta hydrolase superfamily lysophospholipase